MERKKRTKKTEKTQEHEEQPTIASVSENSSGEEMNHDVESSSDSNDVEEKPEVMVDEQKEISTEEIDQPSDQPNESPDDSSEFIAQENNGVEVKQDEEITEAQDIISFPDDSPGGENDDISQEAITTQDDSPEIISAETGDLKTEHEEAPVESESASSEIKSQPETTEDKVVPDEKNNAVYLSSQVDKLIRLKDEHNFVDFWFYVKELNKMIFTLRGLHKEERMKFKDRIGELCEDAKKI